MEVAVPVQHLTTVVITTPTLSAENRTARYLCYRASAIWPAYMAYDPKGDHFSHRGFWLPSSFTLRQNETGDSGVTVAITPTTITLSRPAALDGCPILAAEASGLMEHLADDPIWGPAWLLPVTRHYSALRN